MKLEDLGSQIWTTRNGVVMLWSEMSASHLRNAAAFIRRQHDAQISSGYQTLCMVQGEMAEYTIGSALSRLEDERADIELIAKAMERYADYKEGHINQLKLRFGNGQAR